MLREQKNGTLRMSAPTSAISGAPGAAPLSEEGQWMTKVMSFIAVNNRRAGLLDTVSFEV